MIAECHKNIFLLVAYPFSMNINWTIPKIRFIEISQIKYVYHIALSSAKKRSYKIPCNEWIFACAHTRIFLKKYRAHNKSFLNTMGEIEICIQFEWRFKSVNNRGFYLLFIGVLQVDMSVICDALLGKQIEVLLEWTFYWLRESWFINPFFEPLLKRKLLEKSTLTKISVRIYV